MSLKPAPGQYVVRSATPAETELRASTLPGATVERVAGDPGALVVRLPSATDAAPHGALQALQSAVGQQAAVFPLYEDVRGERLLPTGRVSVRFTHAWPEERLHAFGRKHGLQLVNVNEFQPEQALFEPCEACERSLPDTVAQATSDDGVAAAWPETRGAYRRGQH